jgi:hypothetical protein
MGKNLIGISAVAMLCGICLAQQPAPASSDNNTAQDTRQIPAAGPATQPPPSSPPMQPVANGGQGNRNQRIAPGSVIPVQLTKTIDAKKIKTGDPVEAKVTQDLKNGMGTIVVPKDTKVTGHVTEAQARNKEQKESQVGIAFDHAVLKNAGEVQLPMSIQAIIGTSNMNSNSNTTGDTSNQQTAANNGGMAGNSGGGAAANSGRTGGMGAGGTQTQPSDTSAASSTSGAASNNQSRGGSQPEITGNTKGVVGISNLQLSSGQSAAQGSVVSSEKNNVKLESGTLMLLRVNQ